MPSSVVGEPVWAVLIPPRLARFGLLAELGDTPVTVDVTGRNKYVLLTEDRAFLFPRQADNVQWFNRELATYRALEPRGLPVIPRLTGEWRDEAVSPFPFAAVTRLHCVRPSDASPVLQLGRTIAHWHRLIPPTLPAAPLSWGRSASTSTRSRDLAVMHEAGVRGQFDRPSLAAIDENGS